MEGSIILKDKQAKIILTLKNNQQSWYLTTLAKASGTTYVHACNFIKTCEAIGIVTNEKHGKIKEIKLTEKGMQIADQISTIYSVIAQLQAKQLEAKIPPVVSEKK